MPKRRASNSNDANADPACSSSSQSLPPLRLMLHASNGVVPYMTPLLLSSLSSSLSLQQGDDSASDNADNDNASLWIGMAVADTCIHPVYHSQNKDDNDQKKKTDNNKTKNNNKKNNNPRGYTFSGRQFQVDAWMKGFPRMTVPTFDLWHDQQQREESGKQQQQNSKQKSKKKNTTNNNNNTTDIPTTDQAVMLWTPHGRHKITPAQYWDAQAQGLQSQHAVSLFDMAPPFSVDSAVSSDSKSHSTNRAKQQRRAAAATARTQKWWKDFWNNNCNNTNNSSASCWAPIALHDSYTTQQLQQDIQDIVDSATTSSGQHNTRLAGIALIGWSQLASEQHAVQLLTTAVQYSASSTSSSTSAGLQVAILATTCLRQVLLAAAAGAHVVGTNLPTVWAQQKRAFVLPIPNHNNASSSNSNNDNKGERHPKKKRLNGDPEDGDEKPDTLDADGCVALSIDDDDANVAEHPWFRDTRPLVPLSESASQSSSQTTATNIVMTQHSRAYIYHLVCAKELNAEILLFQHNLHQLLQLLHYCRKERKGQGAKEESTATTTTATDNNNNNNNDDDDEMVKTILAPIG